MTQARYLFNVFLAVSSAMLLSACISSGRSIPAPVEDKVQPRHSNTAKPSASSSSAKTVPHPNLAESTAKPGYYTVKQGDTLIKIGLDHGQNWRDIMRWNAIDNPNLIEVGQVLRITMPPESEQVVVKPVAPPGNLTSSNTEPKTSSSPASPAATANTTGETTEEHLVFAWPVQGALLSSFDDSKNKGIDIGGKAGDAVLASADGKVVYAGAGLRGYGNLVILKHNSTYLTAYAHNQVLTVKEDQVVKRGQKIAEMGNSDADIVKLHFEIRKMGKPIDPLKLLSAR